MELASCIELTRLSPDMVQGDVDLLVKQADEHGFHGICVPPFWVKHARREIANSGLRLITVVGFPMGYQLTETKLDEITRVIDQGADEIDMVWNISAFKSGMPWTRIELARCTQAVHAHQRLIKVIIETGLLNEDEIAEACRMCAEAGADFVKTSTGFSGEGAREDHIRGMRAILPSNVGIKASGGIKTADQPLAMIKAGADRIGTSSGVGIMEEMKRMKSSVQRRKPAQ